MNPYVISCCSTADLSEEHFRNRNISYVCFHFELDGVEYPDDLGKSIPFDEFYRRAVEEYDVDYIKGQVGKVYPEDDHLVVQGVDLLANEQIIHINCLPARVEKSRKSRSP